MASFKDNAQRSKNQFAARTVSRKTGAMIGWVHITDEFSRKVMGAPKASEVTYERALSMLPQFYENDLVELAITDMSAEAEVVEATEY